MKKFLLMSFLICLPLQAMQVSGGTLLHAMVAFNTPHSVLPLLKNISPMMLNAQTQNGSTALHIAVGPISSLNHWEVENKKIIIQALLAQGINTQLEDNMGMTARDKLCNSNFIGKWELLAVLDKKN
jgi:hypothetical protein